MGTILDYAKNLKREVEELKEQDRLREIDQYSKLISREASILLHRNIDSNKFTPGHKPMAYYYIKIDKCFFRFSYYSPNASLYAALAVKASQFAREPYTWVGINRLIDIIQYENILWSGVVEYD